MITIYDKFCGVLYPATDLYPSTTLYPQDELVLNDDWFTNNGYGVLQDFVSNPIITEVLNGDYTLEFEYALEGWLSEYIIIDNLIKASNNGTDQIFRIYYVDKSLNRIKVLARHIVFDLNDNLLVDVRPTDLNGEDALNWCLDRTAFIHGFTAESDIADELSAYYIRLNFNDVFFNADNSFINTWGGNFEFDNFVIKLHEERGSDNGVTIRYGKNILGINFTADITNVVTRILPVGNNELLLPELYVDSAITEYFHSPIIRVLQTNIGVDDTTTEEQAYALMRLEAGKEFIRLQSIFSSAKIDFVELSKVKEYEQYSDLETLALGDTVTIWVSQLEFDYTMRVVRTDYDCLKERFIKIELSGEDV